MQNNSKHDLTSAPIPSLVKQIAIPASIGFFFNTMFNVVDAFYGGKLGTEALAAMSASFPVFFIIIALSSGIGTASSSLIANALGKKDPEAAKEYYLTSIIISLIVSILLTCIGLISGETLFKNLGLSGKSLTYALDYTNVIFYGTIFFILSNVLNSFLTATGDSKTFRNTLILGSLLNVLLDPWFMYGWLGFPALGLKGIALSTIFIQFIQCLGVGIKLRRSNILRGFRKLKFHLKVAKEIIAQAIPSSFSMTTVAIGSFIITFYLGKYGELVVAAYGTAIRIEQIALLPTIGLNIAALSLIGQNNGAGNFTRIREVMSLCLKYGAYISILSFFLLIFFGKAIMGIFSSDKEVIAIGAHYLIFASLIFYSYVILFIQGSALQGIKKPTLNLWLSLFRQIIVPLLLFYVIVTKLKLNLNYVWISILAINWISAIISIKLVKKILRKEEELRLSEAKKF